MKLKDLKNGYLYEIDARNASYGIWRSRTGSFIISRFKFYENFLFDEIHVELSSDFGTATPLLEIEQSPFDMESDLFLIEKKVLDYLNTFVE
jgi:hypothetical protein